MADAEKAEKAELIIVRRRSTLDSDEGKNSVWKIAYADFMTAMMAFFLVMWLISATNQETRESVASYFNPIKLANSTPDRKGLSDARRVDPGKAEEGSTVTDAVLDEVAAWQQRPLDAVYPLVFSMRPRQDPRRRHGPQQGDPYRLGRPRGWRQGGSACGSSRMKGPNSGCAS